MIFIQLYFTANYCEKCVSHSYNNPLLTGSCESRCPVSSTHSPLQLYPHLRYKPRFCINGELRSSVNNIRPKPITEHLRSFIENSNICFDATNMGWQHSLHTMWPLFNLPAYVRKMVFTFSSANRKHHLSLSLSLFLSLSHFSFITLCFFQLKINELTCNILQTLRRAWNKSKSTQEDC